MNIRNQINEEFLLFYFNRLFSSEFHQNENEQESHFIDDVASMLRNFSVTVERVTISRTIRIFWKRKVKVVSDLTFAVMVDLQEGSDVRHQNKSNISLLSKHFNQKQSKHFRWSRYFNSCNNGYNRSTSSAVTKDIKDTFHQFSLLTFFIDMKEIFRLEKVKYLFQKSFRHAVTKKYERYDNHNKNFTVFYRHLCRLT